MVGLPLSTAPFRVSFELLEPPPRRAMKRTTATATTPKPTPILNRSDISNSFAHGAHARSGAAPVSSPDSAPGSGGERRRAAGETESERKRGKRDPGPPD